MCGRLVCQKQLTGGGGVRWKRAHECAALGHKTRPRALRTALARRTPRSSAALGRRWRHFGQRQTHQTGLPQPGACREGGGGVASGAVKQLVDLGCGAHGGDGTVPRGRPAKGAGPTASCEGCPCRTLRHSLLNARMSRHRSAEDKDGEPRPREAKAEAPGAGSANLDSTYPHGQPSRCTTGIHDRQHGAPFRGKDARPRLPSLVPLPPPPSLSSQHTTLWGPLSPRLSLTCLRCLAVATGSASPLLAVPGPAPLEAPVPAWARARSRRRALRCAPRALASWAMSPPTGCASPSLRPPPSLRAPPGVAWEGAGPGPLPPGLPELPPSLPPPAPPVAPGPGPGESAGPRLYAP